MTEIIFGLIILALLGSFAVFIREEKKERAKLINALIAKTPQDAINLGMADKVATIKPLQEEPPDMISLDQLNEDEFDQHIAEELQNV